MIENKKKIFFTFFKSMNKKRQKDFVILIFVISVSSTIEFLTLGTVAPLISSILSIEFVDLKFFSILKDKYGLENSFSLLVSTFIFFVILSVIFRIFVMKQSEKFSALLSSDLSSKMFYNTISQKYSKIIDQNSNILISGMTEKTGMYTGLITQFLSMFSSIIISVGIISYLLFYNVHITLLTLIFITTTYFLIGASTKYILDKNGENLAKFSGERFKIIQESIAGIREIIINSSQKMLLNIYKNYERKFRLSTYRIHVFSNSPKLIIEGLGIITLLLISFFYFKTALGNDMQFLISLAVFAFAAQKLLPLINTFYQSWTGFKSLVYLVDDIHELISREPSMQYTENNLVNLTTNKKLEFKNVDFKYENSNKNIFSNFNYKVHFNSKIGVTGKTGVGKSTLIDLLMGLLEPTNGQILVDDKILNNSSMNSWHGKISHVPQSAFLLNDTIEKNITFSHHGENIDKEKLLNSCEDALLSDFINQLPKGLNTLVGERGINLSGGQKQRITIARALYNRKKILILDEATNALDYNTEKKILSNIEKKYFNKTLVIISHRIDTLNFLDEIIDLNNIENNYNEKK